MARALSVNAVADRAEVTRISGRSVAPAFRSSPLAWASEPATVGAGGAASRTTWALAPPKPKELTPATSGRPSGHASCSVTTRSRNRAKSIAGFGVEKCRDLGIRRWWRLRATLHNPAIPEAASRWPTLVLTEPRAHHDWRPRDPSLAGPNTAPNALASIGSPTGVPVPWASTYATAP